MKKTDILIINFEEVRRRSLKVWSGIMTENYFWKPDPQALSCLEMVRHVLESEHFIIGSYLIKALSETIHPHGMENHTLPWKTSSTLQDNTGRNSWTL